MKIISIALTSALLLSACSPASTSDTPLTLRPETINIAPIGAATIRSDCQIEGILKTTGNIITCVTLPFPEAVTSAADREDHAEDIARQYADMLISKGWSVTSAWPLIYVFEKPVSDECSNTVQFMTWVLDMKKAPEDRNFDTSQITFSEREALVCGDKRRLGKQ